MISRLFRPSMRGTNPIRRTGALHDSFLIPPGATFFNNFDFPPLERIAADIIETPQSFKVEAEVPGFSKDSLNIKAEGSTLYISGTHEAPEDKDNVGRGTISKERLKESFERTIYLPSKVDPSKISASLENGVLSLDVPKSITSDLVDIKIQ